MIIRLAGSHKLSQVVIKRFMRGLPITRDTTTHDESPPDPFMCGNVSRKKDISGEYLMKEHTLKENVNFWENLSRSSKKMDNEQDVQDIPVGKVRRDSDNQPRYHGQYAPENTKFMMDERTYEAVIASHRAAGEPSTVTDARTSQIQQVDENPDEPEKEEEALNVDDFFPNRRSLDTKQKQGIGQFTFKCKDDWFDSDQCNRAKDPFSIDRATSFLNAGGEPDQTVLQGLTFAKESPIRSMAELDEEIDAIAEETAAEQAEDEAEEKDEEEGEDAETGKVTGESGETPEVTEEEKKSMTALDYVMKLRKGEMKPESAKLKEAFETANVNALDSQGFNSYKGYVPDLTQYRRTELIWILKKSILFCDSDILAINKPYGLIVQGKEKKEDSRAPVLADLLEELAELLLREKLISEPKKLRIVHRMDKEATGVLLMAMSQEKAAFLQKAFEERNVEKVYHVITKSVPDPRKGIIDIPIEEGIVDGKERMVLRPELREGVRKLAFPSKHAKRAVTEFRVLADKGNAALIEVKPVTGVKHQIRVHMGFGMRCPILGDHKYTYLDRIAPQKLPCDMLTCLNVRPSKVRNVPMHLFAKMVMIPGAGVGGKTIFVKAHTPDFFLKTMKRLKLEVD